MSNPVIILGTGGTREACPFDCETWGVNGVYAYRESLVESGHPFRLDKLFITDTLFSTQGTLHFDIERVNQIIREYGTEVISMHPLRLGKFVIPTTPYPFKEITDTFQSQYFTSTIGYMIAYAMYKNKKGIKMYGVDMTTKTEYLLQKGSIEYWLGRAQERGIQLYVTPGGSILVPHQSTPYGITMDLDYSKYDPYNVMEMR